MKSIAVLVAAAAAFAYLLFAPYGSGEDTLARLAAVRARLPRLEPGEAEGYRFAWVRGDDLPPVFVARPEEEGTARPQWFATTDGDEIFAFDTVRYRTRPGGPDLAALRRYLALPDEQRASARLPAGWERTVHSTP